MHNQLKLDGLKEFYVGPSLMVNVGARADCMHRNFIKQSVLCSNLKCNFMEAGVL